MKSHVVLHTVCISGEAAGEIWNLSLLGVKGLPLDFDGKITGKDGQELGVKRAKARRTRGKTQREIRKDCHAKTVYWSPASPFRRWATCGWPVYCEQFIHFATVVQPR